MQFGIGHPPHLHINCSLHVWGRLQGSQIFKRNSIISIRSKVMAFFRDFVVPTWFLLSSRCPSHPHVVPIISVVPIAPRRSPCGLHGLWSPHVVPVVPTSSPLSPHCPRHPHIIPVISIVPIAPRRSPCGLHGLWSPHVVPVIPTLSPSSPHHPHVISTLSPSSP